MIAISNSQVKSRERVAAYGEVFTSDNEVNNMCNLVDDECRRFDSTFLEPACGDGNFLAEILKRKLDALENDSDFERKSLIALASLYGIDIQQDNVEACQKRLYNIWNERGNFDGTLRTRAREIVNANIVCADTLDMTKDIFFTEWTFPEGSITPSGKEFNLRKMIHDGEQKLSEKESGQIGLPFED